MIKRRPNRRRQRELSALLRVAWPQLDVALHVKGGYLEGCDGEPHTRARRAAVGSGDGRRRGAPRGRSQPPPPGAVGGVRARASPRAGEAALSTPEAVRPRGSERAPLRCRLDPQPFALLGGSPAWRPREVHENTGRATPEFSIRVWRSPRVRISDAPRWCRRSGAHAEDTARFIPRRPTPDSPAPSLKRRLVLDPNSITAPQVPRAAGPTRPGRAGTVASAVSPPYRLPPGFPTRRFCS